METVTKMAWDSDREESCEVEVPARQKDISNKRA